MTDCIPQPLVFSRQRSRTICADFQGGSLFADRTSCHDFEANQFRVLLSAAAYVLMETLRREGLAGTELETAQVHTIRLKVLKIGARIVCSVRRIAIHLAGGYPLKDLPRNVLERLNRWTVAVASG